MATKLKRITISLSPEVEQTLARLKKAMGIPSSTMISQLLDEALPALKGIAKGMELAKEKKTLGGAYRIFERSLTQAMLEGLSLQSEVQQRADKLDEAAHEPPND